MTAKDNSKVKVRRTLEFDLVDKARGTLKHCSKEIDIEPYFMFYYCYVYKPGDERLELEERPTAWYKPFNIEVMNKIYEEDLDAIMNAEDYELNKDYYRETPD